MRFKVFHLDWEKGQEIDRETRLDLTGGDLTGDALREAIRKMWGEHGISAYEQVADLDLDEATGDGLETVFFYTNSIDYPWTECAPARPAFRSFTKGSRSTSVGDLVKVPGRRQTFYCAPCGWIEIDW
jgi:hypothetical protein